MLLKCQGNMPWSLNEGKTHNWLCTWSFWFLGKNSDSYLLGVCVRVERNPLGSSNTTGVPLNLNQLTWAAFNSVSNLSFPNLLSGLISAVNLSYFKSFSFFLLIFLRVLFFCHYPVLPLAACSCLWQKPAKKIDSWQGWEAASLHEIEDS